MRAVTILGFGPTAQKLKAEIGKHCVGEIWSLNNGYDVFPIRFDRYFELHNMDYLKTWQANPMNHDHFTRLDLLGCPVFMQEPILKRIRLSRPYPFVDVFQHFGCNYFLGSPSLMIALALYEGITHLRTWGIDTSDDQHKQQRQSWAFWISKAMEMGVQVSGTALYFMAEPDLDTGLTGLRERIGDLITTKEQAEATIKQENDNGRISSGRPASD